MTWITDNWIAIAVAIAFIAFHLFGHRGHGGGGHQHGTAKPDAKAGQPAVPEASPAPEGAGPPADTAEAGNEPPAPPGHRH